ncbi:MAG: hypothetical protein A3B96_00720 [Candidatus Spechtbacteria bacterium RIFCSPHIGHO2_02_FULL_43_15b]|uniref:TraC-like domain-containing protein n=1 Tax=Candidatus Spechtbacteria bacterium RIFCSPHIGHO2_01_FULL_43_30 TaxID=1802158 RepID=A0A1G2H6W8_9BACT|nr:MAG: hypothetical protein A2827_02590 [Candidatus Spechtbacteria bacterium RIFCSPHIGHO2_01_FULL_43_30]OGZ59524.1 MAG: hypothetical protein A3B96_00720 [Candidatus Spechtbacteria bacterium RIFCSPHIGHO2_02_FULL_43_15b]
MAKTTKSTQSFVKINEIKDDVVILKGGGVRALIECSSINFALKSESEQDALVFQFQNFLNSLDFYIQIFINSRFLNIDDYIDMLKAKEQEQQNDLLRIQTGEYIDFIKDFVQASNIVSTDFYVVVPMNTSDIIGVTSSESGGGLFGLLSAILPKPKNEEDAPGRIDPKFEHYKNQLSQRVEFVKAGLHRMGITTKTLNTEELIMLFWNMHNPQNLQKRTLMKSVFEKFQTE